MIRLFFYLAGLLLIASSTGHDARAGGQSSPIPEKPTFTAEQIEFFETEVRPILIQHCYRCHSTDAMELKARLYLDSREGVVNGGESGAAIVVGKPDESLLISAVEYGGVMMPPDRKLDQRSIDALVKWVEMGAPWPEVTSSPGEHTSVTGTNWETFDWAEARREHWAWQPVQRPEIPVVEGIQASSQSIHPIDSFIAARRAQAGIAAPPPAAPQQLARRISIDLIGVPPTPEQVSTFVTTALVNQPLAVETFVNELLDSPMYGQRWARHWLDVARFSDGRGGFLEGDKPLNDAWRYRDWVVDAINRDLPINEFIRLQIAGDLTGDPTHAIATGFFALGPTYQADGGDPDSVARSHAETLDDRVDVLTRGILGITVSCARCHDHKFDPIPQQDYYSLAGVFNNSSTRDLPVPAQDVEKRLEEHQLAVAELRKKIRNLRKQSKRERGADSDNKSGMELTPEQKEQLDQWTADLEHLEKNIPPAQATAHTLYDASANDMKVALRGNLLTTGEVAPRRFLRIIAGPSPARFSVGSGRDELAATVVDIQNPLTYRVFVNRVWQHHFGVGLVRTPSNFGSLGESPTHPELLDWLTSEFIARGLSLKSLHRQIMTSATYQLSSNYDEHSYQADSDNRLYWRMSPRRMDVEAWRDSILFVTGELDSSLGGPGYLDAMASMRRTLYAKVSRNGDVFASDDFLRLFDFPAMRSSVEQRPSSLVPPQFLFLMNSQFMIDRAKRLAGRLSQKGNSAEERIQYAYELLYSRKPDPAELEAGLSFLSAVGDGSELSGWDRYAQVLLSSNEFMFVR